MSADLSISPGTEQHPAALFTPTRAGPTRVVVRSVERIRGEGQKHHQKGNSEPERGYGNYTKS